MSKRKLLFIFFVFGSIVMAQGQEDQKVAVFDPVGDVSQNLKIVIREELSNAVVNTLGFTVLERELINKVLAENEFQMKGHVDDSQIGELGKKMGANYVSYASISLVGGNYYISCKMVDVKTARIERQNTGITEHGLDDLFSVVSTVSRAMLQQQATSVKSSDSKASVYKQVYDVNEADANDLTEIDLL
ncbi:MAG: CsgG/HfaB family protein [Bacteroidales bacterium]